MPEHINKNKLQKQDSVQSKRETKSISVLKGLSSSDIIQKAEFSPDSLTHADVMQLQRIIGNPGVIQLLNDAEAAKYEQQKEAAQMRPIREKSGKEVTQLAIEPNKIRAFKEKLGIPETTKVKIVEVPKNKKINDKFHTFPQGNMNDLEEADKELCCGDVMYPNFAETRGDESFLKANIEDHFDQMGGGGYKPDFNMILIMENTEDRILLHEMGHKKQNLMGFNSDTSDSVILEYHNVLTNENKDDKKIRTYYNEGNVKFNSGKKWNVFLEEFNKSKDIDELTITKNINNMRMINQIEKELENEKYSKLTENIKQNLVNEYYCAKETVKKSQ